VSSTIRHSVLLVLVMCLMRPASAIAQSAAPANPVTVAARFDAEGLSQLLAPVAIGGKTFWCSIDSGGSWVLTLHTAKALAAGLRPNAAGSSAGAGPEVVADQRVRGVDVSVGAVTLPDLTIVLRDQPSIVPDMDCVFGLALLQDYVVEFDYETPRIRIFDAQTFRPPNGVTPLPFELNRFRQPYIGATMTLATGDEIRSNLVIDTGTSYYSAVWVKSFLDSHDVRSRIGLVVPEHAHTPGLVLSAARPTRLTVGPHAVSNPVIALLSSASAGLTEDGTLGAGFLRRFTVTFDYRHKLVWLVPNGRFEEPQPFDASGIEFGYASDGALTIEAIARDSPAAAAGFQPGDRLVRIDGRGADSVTLRDVKTILSRANTICELRVDRKGELRTATLRLVKRL